MQIDYNYSDNLSILCPALSFGSGGGSVLAVSRCISVFMESREYADELDSKVVQKGNLTATRKVLPYEFSMLSLSSDGVTLIDANIAMMDVVGEYGLIEFSAYRAFSLEASAGITQSDGAHVKAMASIFSASVSVDFGFLEFSATGYLGAIGATAGFDLDGFTVGVAKGVGFEFSANWGN